MRENGGGGLGCKCFLEFSEEGGKCGCHGDVHCRLWDFAPQVSLDVSGEQTTGDVHVLTIDRNTEPTARVIITSHTALLLLLTLHTHT